MDIKLILENQYVIMQTMSELAVFTDDRLRAQITKTKERLDHWGSEA